MKTLTIDLDNLKKTGIDFVTYCISQLILEGISLKEYLIGWNIDNMLIQLETYGFIKIINKETYEVEPREKLIQLFQKSEKNVEAIEVLNYLNQKIKSKSSSKRGFDIKSQANLKFINARLKSGYSKQDLIKVIDKKFKDWWGTSMQSYIRPETLFNETKFQGYINEIGDNDSNTFNPVEMC